MKNFITKNKITIAIVILIAISLFLRTYHLADWLHFQLDQSRDSFLIKDVVQRGIAELPLLGPRAGGSFLRLGPAYYYIMYLFVLVSQNFHPIVFALPEIIGSIAFVPIFYLLARRIFNPKWSLILTLLAVTSTFLTTYDRFSWNPNFLPLFSALTIYPWLRYFEAKREEKYKTALQWIALTALAVGIFIQLHFVAFVALPIILFLTATIFWLRSKFFEPALAKKYLKNIVKEIIVFLAIFVFTQTPVILNEYLSKGINTKELFSTVAKKEEKDQSHKLSEKIIQNLWVYPKGYFITTTGIQGVDFPVWQKKPSWDIVCDYKCRASLSVTAAAAVIFLLVAISFLATLIRKTRLTLKIKEKSSRTSKIVGEWEFLILLTVWILVPWWAFYSLSFSLRPRFFLFSVVPFWIITGLFFREIFRNALGKKIVMLLPIAILVSNALNTYARFDTARSASLEDRGHYPKDQILFQDESYPVTLNQEETIAQWIKEESLKSNPENYIFLWAPSFYYRPILYLLSNIEDENKVFYFSHNPMWLNGNYFAVTRSTTPNDFFKGEKAEMFTTIDKKIIGTLAVYKLELTEKGRETAKNGENKFIKGKEFSSEENTEARCTKKPKPSCRYLWGDLFQ